MGRPRGKRNEGNEERRIALCRAIVPALLDAGRPATLKHMAAAADVSVPTLRHYFGDRTDVVEAVLEQAHRDAAPYLETAFPEGVCVQSALRSYLCSVAVGWRTTPLGTLFVGGLAAGLERPRLGHAVVDYVLEPTLQTLEARLARYVAQGRIDPGTEVRHAALQLLSPLLVALIHQHDLDGSSCRPLEIVAFIDDLVERFARAHALP